MQETASEASNDSSAAPDVDFDAAVESAISSLKGGDSSGEDQADKQTGVALADDKAERSAGEDKDGDKAHDEEPNAEKKDAATSPPIKLPEKPKASEWMQLRQQQKQLREQKTQWEQERAKLSEQAGLADKIKAKAQEDVTEALKLMGWDDPEKFLNHLVETGGKITPEQRRQRELEAKVAAWEQKEEERKQQEAQQAEQQQLQAGIDNWHRNIADYIKQTPGYADKLVAIPGTESAVFDVMQAHYEETGGEKMEFADAVEQVNAQMESKAQALIDEIASNSRGLAILQDIVAKRISKQGAARHKAPGLQTVRSQTQTRAPAQLRPMEEELEEVIAALNGR